MRFDQFIVNYIKNQLMNCKYTLKHASNERTTFIGMKLPTVLSIDILVEECKSVEKSANKSNIILKKLKIYDKYETYHTYP